MPIEDWVHHWIAARFLYDWQTLIAGVLAVLAAAGTILATIKSANPEIKAVAGMERANAVIVETDPEGA
jgi:hypothetical protein